MSSSSAPAPHDREFSLFLLPCKQHEELLRLINQECCSIVPCAQFIPHLTVYFGSGTPHTTHLDLIETIGKTFAPVTQAITGCSGEDRFWRAGYLQLSGGAHVAAIDQYLRTSISDYGPYSFFPHVSLIYSHSISATDREAIALTAKSYLDKVGVQDLLFDRIALIHRESPELSWEDVSRWRITHESSLYGSH
jgi:hypothetical protein